MNHGAAHFFLALIGAAFGLATLSVVLSNNSATSSVIGAGTQGLAAVIGAATAPVTGTSGNGLLGQSLSTFNPLAGLSSINALGGGGIIGL